VMRPEGKKIGFKRTLHRGIILLIIVPMATIPNALRR
jgi:hypothetical protein